MKLWQLLFLVLLVGGGCTTNPKERGWEFFPNMVHPVSYQPYSDRMLEAVPGTVARGVELYPENDKNLTNPIAVDAAVIQRGKEVYQTKCLVCHGETGKGDGPLIPKFPNPPSFSTKRIKELSDGAIFHTITYGVGLMPPHALQVLPRDRWMLVHYVKQLREEK